MNSFAFEAAEIFHVQNMITFYGFGKGPLKSNIVQKKIILMRMEFASINMISPKTNVSRVN